MRLLPTRSKSSKPVPLDKQSTCQDDLQRNGIGALKTTLKLAAVAAQALPTQIPKAALELALELFTSIELTKNLVKSTEDTTNRLEMLSDRLKDLSPDDPVSETPSDLSTHVIKLIAQLAEISQKCRKPPRSGFSRFLTREEDASDLQAIATEMQNAVRDFQLWSFIRQEQTMNRVDRRLQHVERDGRDDRLRERLRPVAQATRDSSRVDTLPKYLPGTRVKVLDDIMAWITKMSPGTPRVFSLVGMAGTGKSTIAAEVATRAATLGLLAASFFFSRTGENDLRKPTKVLPTLAYQLSLTSRELKDAIYDAVEQHPDIADMALVKQVDVLLKPSLSAIGASTKPILIIMDAFDECEGDAAKQLLHLLLISVMNHDILSTSPIKLFITGRPEIYIEREFRSTSASQQIVLHNIEAEIVEGDIRLYIETSLATAQTKFVPDAPQNWFERDELETLVKRSARLFIYAATIIRYIESDPPAYPRHQLDNVLQASATSSSVFSALDTLYLEILGKVSSSPPEIRVPIRNLLGSLILMRDSLPLQAVDKFLAFKSGSSRSFLGTLTAVFILPANDDGAVVVYHPSFSDFLMDPDRCSDPHILIHPSEHQKRLATRCLATLLAEPLSNSRDTSFRYAAVESIPHGLRYSSLYWATHLAKSPKGDTELISLLDTFTRTHMFRWLEILSFIREVRKGAKCLDDALAWATRSGSSAATKAILRDGYRFITAFATSIEHGPVHLYNSALAWCPRDTALWKMYREGTQNTVQVVRGLEPQWNPAISTLEGHTRAVLSVAFSPDSAKLASGSDDYTVRIWDSTTGGCITTLEGHTKYVTSVMFSPDGTKLASGSCDHTVRLWDSITGRFIAALEGHTDFIWRVMFSPDSTHLASCSRDKTVRLWDSTTGTCIVTLEGHTDDVETVAFSPDGMKLASGSRDHTVRIWDSITGGCMATLEGHRYRNYTVAFSPDSTRLASGSTGHTVRIWDSTTGGCISTLEAHTQHVRSIAFSPNGTKLASGSEDTTVRIWDSTTGRCIATLEGHNEHVISVMFSPDGTKLASGSLDSSMRIWDSATCNCLATLRGHTYAILTVAFSPDGTKLASGSQDHTVRIWDSITTAYITTLEAHTRYVKSIVFSPNGMTLASWSDHGDQTVRMWNPITGSHVATLEGHTHTIHTVIFSPDSTMLASFSYDNTIRTWDSITGGCIVILEGHTDPIERVVFSSDSTKLASSSRDGTIRIWHSSIPRCIAALQGHSMSRTVRSIVFSPDGTKLASGSGDMVQMWDTTIGKCIATLEGHTGWVWSLVFSPDGSKLASGSLDKTVRMWDSTIGVCVSTLEGHTGEIVSVVFSPDGTRLASESRDSTVRIWDTSTGCCVYILGGHTISSDAILFSTDGTQLSTPLYGWNLVSDTQTFNPASINNIDTQEQHSNLDSVNSEPPTIFAPFTKLSITGHSQLLGKSWLGVIRDVCYIPTVFKRWTDLEVCGDVIAFGCFDGRVVILNLKDWIPASQ